MTKFVGFDILEIKIHRQSANNICIYITVLLIMDKKFIPVLMANVTTLELYQ